MGNTRDAFAHALTIQCMQIALTFVDASVFQLHCPDKPECSQFLGTFKPTRSDKGFDKLSDNHFDNSFRRRLPTTLLRPLGQQLQTHRAEKDKGSLGVTHCKLTNMQIPGHEPMGHRNDSSQPRLSLPANVAYLSARD